MGSDKKDLHVAKTLQSESSFKSEKFETESNLTSSSDDDSSGSGHNIWNAEKSVNSSKDSSSSKGSETKRRQQTAGIELKIERLKTMRMLKK